MIVNDVHLAVMIGEKAVPWPETGAGVVACTIFIRQAYICPAVKLVLQDEGNFVGSKFSLNDGDLITVRWGKGQSVYTTPFRIASIKATAHHNTFFYTIYGWANNITWMAENNNKSYKGTSSEVIAKLGSECGYTVDVDNTSDSQTWLGCSDSYSDFARKIAKRGYSSDDSVMTLAVGPDYLRYKDVNKIDFGKPYCAFQLGQGQVGSVNLFGGAVTSFPMTSCNINNKAGNFNLHTGYKSSHMDNNIEDRSKAKAATSAPVKLKTDEISHNSLVTDKVTTPRANFSAPKTDNTHDNYNKADYQNGRGLRTLKNATVDFTTNTSTGIVLLDPIWLLISGTNMGATGADGNASSPYDGPYMVIGRNIHITGGIYAERLTASREGIIKK